MSAPTSLKAGDPVKAGTVGKVRHFDRPASRRVDMEFAGAEWIGELKGTFSRKEILSALVAADSPAAIPALFAQLREMGVSCRSCLLSYGCCEHPGGWQGPKNADKFLCDEWVDENHEGDIDEG